jgi:hypothetical protein
MTVRTKPEDHGLKVLPDITDIDLIRGIGIIEVRQETHIEINDTTGVNQQKRIIIQEIKNETIEVLVIIGINQIMKLRINSLIILGRTPDRKLKISFVENVLSKTRMKKKNAPFIGTKLLKNVENAIMAIIILKNVGLKQEVLQQIEQSPHEKTRIVCTKCI